MPTWKRILLRSAGFGAGVAIVVCLAVGVLAWYKNRPQPPKQWDSTALVSTGSAGFELTRDGKKLRLYFVVENKTAEDYNVWSRDQLRIVSRLIDGSLSQPLASDAIELDFPIFIPARQKGRIRMDIPYSGLPVKTASESDDDFHERLRQFINKEFDGFGGLAVYDETNKYQVNLPKWLSKKPG